MKFDIKGSVVLITGGTGTFGKAFLDKCLILGAREVRIFSRDEKKQYDMMQMYREHPEVRFFLGDIRDKTTIDKAMPGVDFVFHAAAMKQVPSCESFPMEAIKTNVAGSNNVIESAVAHGVKKIVCLSTDKAVYPTSAMGMTKAYMEKLALQKADEMERLNDIRIKAFFEDDSIKGVPAESPTTICITRFGNLIASRGSAVPLFIEQVQNGCPITITEPDMTRFIMTVDEATDLVQKAFEKGRNGDIFIKKSYACETGALAQAVISYMNIPESYPVQVIGSRPGEKLHEALMTEEETPFAYDKGNYIIIRRERLQIRQIDKPYSSDKAELLSEDSLVSLIKKVFAGGVH